MKRAALFVGINDYNNDKELTSLKCARKDADTLYCLFLKEYTHGMVDYLHDVNSDEIIKSIEKTMESLTEGDLFFFYFSGHGIEERNNHLLLTSGARRLGDEWHHALSVNKLKYLTQKTGVQTVFVIDSCRESVYKGARSAGVAELSRGMTMKRVVEEKSADAAMLPPVILCSCASGERAFEIEETGHGIFTLALKECLESGKFFTLDEIANDVTERLKSFISKHNFSGHQTPELHKSPGVNPVLWGAVADTPSDKQAKKQNQNQNQNTFLAGEALEKYFLLREQVQDLTANNEPEFQKRFAEIDETFSLGNQQGAYNDLQKLQDDLNLLQLAASYKERLKKIEASYPADLMKAQPQKAKDYKIKQLTADNLFNTKRFSDALKKLDELEAIQQSVLAQEAKRVEEEKRAAEAKRVEEEKRVAEAKRLEEEKRVAEAKRLEEEKRAAEEAKRIEAEKMALNTKYNSLYKNARSLLDNGGFPWIKEFELRLQTCEYMFKTGSKQEGVDSLTQLFKWHKLRLDFAETEEKHVSETQKTANAKRAAELKQFDNEIKEIEKKWQKKEQTKQPEAEKKLSWGQRIWGFFADYLLSFFILFLCAVSVLDAIKNDGITSDCVGYTTVLLLYLILLLCRKYWYFVLCNLFMGVLCLSLFNSGWWWFACVPAAFIVFCVLCSDDVSEKNKKCKFVYIYLGLFQAMPLWCAFDSVPLMICGLYCSLFFPLIYTYPKFISLLTAVTCGILAFTWSAWWWIGVALFLFILLCVWGDESEKKEKNKNTETLKQ